MRGETIEEFREEKYQLEKAIQRRIDLFQEKYNAKVDIDVSISSVTSLNNNSTIYSHVIKLQVEL